MIAEELQNRIRNYVRKTGMLKGGDRVLVCLSGGADSVFLFYFLKQLSGKMDFEMRAVHVHHGIRGNEADRDEKFVRELCAREEVPLMVFRRDVPKAAAESGKSLEEAGRIVRYDCFREAAEAWAEGRSPLPKIALAHHMDDQAETVLFRIVRGTGIHGLKGMEPVREEAGTVYIRPLLCVRRWEIRNFLTEKEVSWVEDSTNGEPDAARNRIRRDILPLLASEVNSAAVEHLSQLAVRAAEADVFLQEEAGKREGVYIHALPHDRKGMDECGSTSVLIDEALLSESAWMQKELTARAIRKAAGGARDIGGVHIESVLGLLKNGNGSRLDLMKGLEAVRSEKGVCVRGQPGFFDSVPDPADVAFKLLTIAEPMKSIPQLKYTKWLDYDKMNNVPSVRTRQNGDFLTIDAAGHTKTLSDYFTNEKIPRELRDHVLLVADGQEIAWVVGYRIGYRYRVTEETRNVLEASYLPRNMQ